MPNIPINEFEAESYGHVPFMVPVPIPTLPFDQGHPRYAMCINGQWMARVLGALETLLQLDTWRGDRAAQQAAVDEATRMLASLYECEEPMAIDECCEQILSRLDIIIGLMSAPNDAPWIDFRQTILNEVATNGFTGTQESIPQTTFFNDTGADDAQKIADYNQAFCWLLSAALGQARAQLQGVLNTIGETFIGAGVSVIFAPPLGWLGAGVAVVAGLAGLGVLAYAAAIDDQNARKNVICCLLSSLDERAVTREQFKEALDTCAVGGNETIIADFLKQWVSNDVNWAALLHDYGVAFDQIQEGVPLECICDDGNPCDTEGNNTGIDVFLNPPGSGLVIDLDAGACGFGRKITYGFTFTRSSAFCLHNFILRRNLSAPISNEATWAVLTLNGKVWTQPIVHSGGDAGSPTFEFDPPQLIGPGAPIRVDLVGGGEKICIGNLRYNGVVVT